MGLSNMYCHLTDYQRISGTVKATLLVLSLWDNQTCTVTSLITRGPVVLLRQLCRFCHCETIKHVQSPHWLPEDQWSCLNSFEGFVTVRQSNIYSHLTDYQRTSGPVKNNIVRFVTLGQSNTYSHLTNSQRISAPVKVTLLVLSLWDTIKHVQSPHWLQEDQWSCKNNIVGFVTVRQSNMYSHLTDYQRINGPVKTTMLVLSLWDNHTCTVTPMITRETIVL